MIREVIHCGHVLRFQLDVSDAGHVVTLAGTGHEFRVEELSPGRLVIENSRGRVRARVARTRDRIYVWIQGRSFEFLIPSAEHDGGEHGEASRDEVCAPMPGTIIKLSVAVGDEVREGQVVAVVEAMKMEHPLRAPRAGRVQRVEAAVGAVVDADAVVVSLLPEVTAS